MARVKVVQRWPGAPRLLIVLATGLALGSAMCAYCMWIMESLSQQSLGALIIISGQIVLASLAVMTLLVAPAVMVGLSLREQRRARSVVEAITLAGGQTLGIVLTELVARNSMPAFWACFGALTVLYIPIRLGTLWLVRTWFRRVVLQDGAMCWICGYNLTGNISGICPECGTPISSQAPADLEHTADHRQRPRS